MKTGNVIKHTPGPWGAENALSSDYYNIRYVTGPNCEQVATIHQREELCNVDKNPPMSQDEALANARLIAAAPELLEALKGILNAGSYDDDGDFVLYHNNHTEDCDTSDPECLVAAYKAIAKAEGGE